MSNLAFQIFALIFAMGFFLYSTFWFLRSLMFYSRNGWDFSREYGPTIYRSEFQSKSEEVKPKLKLFLYQPLTMAVTGAIAFPLLVTTIRQVIYG